MNAFPGILNPLALHFWLRIGAAVLCGGIVGLERQLRGKPAGIRTSILICLGTQFFVSLGASFAGEHADPTRVLGQVVTGIGFLGAGVILAREGLVLGVGIGLHCVDSWSHPSFSSRRRQWRLC